MNYRNLTAEEIQTLKQQGCQARSWDDVKVSDPFVSAQVNNVCFTGKVYLGPNVTLRNIQDLGSTGDTSFANGVEVGVLKEDGGLEVLIYDGLTSMEAAFMVQEANKTPELVKALHQKVKDYAASVRCDGSVIEEGAVVTDTRQLTDVHIGPKAHVVGAIRLEDVSICSLPEAKSGVGDGVIMEHVIVASDSHIGDGAQLDYCFVGQGCHIGRMFSAAQSLFFANCHFENGEACAYFAGPYSVSHHKATLMIACQTSFFNAGSGSNQSNHSYKMGPNKYGQLQRGAKLGSNSYVYWPMEVGVFSTVIGHHTGHQDLRDLPFSLITNGSDGRTMIVPGQNLGSVGTRRDANKWPKRDKRTAGVATRRDLINFEMLNPFTVSYILKGISLLEEMEKNEKNEYNGCPINHRHIIRGMERYRQAIDMYLGQVLSRPEVAACEDASAGTGDWADYGGMLVPRKEMLELLAQGGTFEQMAALVPAYEMNWVAAHFDISDKEALIARGKEAEAAWNEYLDMDGANDLAACNVEL